MTTYIGIDNGVSGTIGIIAGRGYILHPMPTKNELSYTKVKKFINRIDTALLREMLHTALSPIVVAIERPMVNPQRWTASMSAIRALEATLCVLEWLQIPYSYIDSKEWQRAMLPSGLKGAEELKRASLSVGKRLFPLSADRKLKDMDGLLIAAYLKQKTEGTTYEPTQDVLPKM